MYPELKHDIVQTNGISLHVVKAGPNNGPVVILLHGFPEFWYGWRYQIPYLALAGYQVWVPDQRGYNLSDKPVGVNAYNLDELAADVLGLIEASGRDKVSLVGHDWGAAVAWWVVNKYPHRFEHLVILNVPHHVVMHRHMRRSFSQMLRSWYIFFFQVPHLPETAVRLAQWFLLERVLRRSSRKGTFTTADLELYRQAWSQPGAITAMISWYRALFQSAVQRPESFRITVPTLLIWGGLDKFLGREMAGPSIDLCDDGHLVLLPEASHWVQHEENERVNKLIDDFMRYNP
ncbi:alpha/beta fold hydrolase [candidate division CSSED10-310 bacterium]|uniref:Alpha/beta fold hydrolase n=1 Tax=candidate division CSSED10-310 bacterium TaxID=2855610 RepID=A0ABV6YWL5_UNCC1